MSLLLAGLIVLASTTVAVIAMLLVRRRAPDGSFFHDGDRAAGVFGVLATGFAVLLGFIVFLAFTSYDKARTGAETEAEIVSQQMETAILLPEGQRGDLAEGLVCYARSVAGVQWQRMEDGTIGAELNPWAEDLFATIRAVEPRTTAEQAAYARWLEERGDREQARNDRIHGAEGVIPLPLWFVLFFISSVIFVYMLFFSDSGERAIVQALLMGSVVAVIVSLLMLLQFLDDPFHDGVGGLRPVAMERTLEILQAQVADAGLVIEPPCDEIGNPI